MIPPLSPPVAVSVGTAAMQLGTSQDVIRDAIRAYRDGDPTGLPAAKLGARWSIRWVDLMAWYEAHTTPTH